MKITVNSGSGENKERQEPEDRSRRWSASRLEATRSRCAHSVHVTLAPTSKRKEHNHPSNITKG